MKHEFEHKSISSSFKLCRHTASVDINKTDTPITYHIANFFANVIKFELDEKAALA